jgi:hypothetical protein
MATILENQRSKRKLLPLHQHRDQSRKNIKTTRDYTRDAFPETPKFWQPKGLSRKIALTDDEIMRTWLKYYRNFAVDTSYEADYDGIVRREFFLRSTLLREFLKNFGSGLQEKAQRGDVLASRRDFGKGLGNRGKSS